jgi:hydrogenase expression/formation protein HypD
MKHLEEYRSSGPVMKVAGMIRQHSRTQVRFMEVCGGHTMTLHKYGLLSLLPQTISLISGPGCPVCVSGQGFIAALIGLVSDPSVIITTYGDLLRIPAGDKSLEKERSSGADIRIVYSVTEALDLARKHPDRKIVFAGIGFETTAPITAAAILRAKADHLKNFFVYSSHKIMPPALEWIAENSREIRGFIAPGHVTAVTGTGIYERLAGKYNVSVVVSGFEPADMMLAIAMLVRQAESGVSKVENAYRRVVRPEGNPRARGMMEEVFQTTGDHWRGVGFIEGSGLQIRPAFSRHDAKQVFGLKEEVLPEPSGCICGRVITGHSTPAECRLFGRSCTPENPVGACMVSPEGTCSVWYKFTSAS